MGLNTAQGRMSVFQVPGVMTNPFPSGFVTKADRQQISDVYAGLPAFTQTIPSGSTTWTRYKKGSSTWAAESKVTDIWIPETKKAPDTWPDEVEIRSTN